MSGNPGHVLAVYAANSQVIENIISNSASGKCIYPDRTADNITIVGNLLFDCEGGIGFSNLSGAVVWHNTITGHSGTGITVGQASGVDIRNNIISHNGGYGVNGGAAVLDFNLMFQNAQGNCNGCTPGANTEYGDPDYEAPGSNDYSLSSTSPAIDAGEDLGLDRNGAAAGLFNGAAPDMGYLEST